MLKWFVLWSAVTFLMCTAHVAFTNLKCNFIDKSYGDFQYCYIKAVNRTHKYISIYAKMVPQSLNNIWVNIQLLRKSNGYKPFFTPNSFDVCKFLKKPNNPLLLSYYNMFKECSNLNHTCPYDHDLIIDRFYTGDHELSFARYLPIPHGDYIVAITFLVRNAEVAQVKLYVKLT
ncbi:uncharacterized protein LOC6581232 [Drosophila mojavensis]|uniref:MD-2-related lipid-recognition domain-containing protein n=1 Tax=Drosophila mojavensis TaxID=7230 RepID=B4KW62_DROMO|nr:uncharacterized protein LOC6581232 [Drosophila mojavensis]EDW17450.2 uncharacterized protein Dmoj_GI12637 [Drosophila mojavensis]